MGACAISFDIGGLSIPFLDFVQCIFCYLLFLFECMALSNFYIHLEFLILGYRQVADTKFRHSALFDYVGVVHSGQYIAHPLFDF